jgi:hypothetical protein
VRPGRIRRVRRIERAVTKVRTKTVWCGVNDIVWDGSTKKIFLYEREEGHSVESKVSEPSWGESCIPEEIIIESDNKRAQSGSVPTSRKAWASSDAVQDIKPKELVKVGAPSTLINQSANANSFHMSWLAILTRPKRSAI